MRHALIDKDNKVVNIIIWEGAALTPPKFHMIVRSDDAHIGDIYDPETNTFKRAEALENKE